MRALKEDIQRRLRAILQTWLKRIAIGRAELVNTAQAEGLYRALSGPERVNCLPPVAFYPHLPAALAGKQGPFGFSPPFYLSRRHVVLKGKAAMAYSGGRPILETAVARLDCGCDSLLADFKASNFRPYLAEPVEKLDLAFSLVNVWSYNYFHWLLECLPRLEALEAFCRETGQQPVLIIDGQLPSWKSQSLELLGYSPDVCHRWRGNAMAVRQLLIASAPREQGRTSPRACRWLAQRCLGAIVPGAGDGLNLYVSRRLASTRRILNEDSLWAALEPLNFHRVCLEELSFAQQVQLFHRARLVVAPHGSGLANMIFAVGVSIVEIFGDDYINPCFYSLAGGLGFDYIGLRFPSRQRHILVNVDQVMNAIYQLWQ